MDRRRCLRSFAVLFALAGVLCAPDARAQTEQTVLGPGMYVFQTRTRSASCGDDEQTGYVSTFMAPIHGIPGSRTMRMTLPESEYWRTWRVTVDARNQVVGDSTLNGASGANAPTNHFEVSRRGDRFVGTGERRYRSNGRDCRVEYDALLRRIDQL